MPKYTITIPDDATEALDALAYERDRVIAAGQSDYTIEDVITDAIVSKFAGEREGQLIAVAQAKAEQDPALVAYRAKKAQEQSDVIAAVTAVEAETREV